MHDVVRRAFVRIPPDRLGVVIGEGGSVKREIERLTGTKITIDTVNGGAIVEQESGSANPLGLIKAQEILRAIALGFSPERAYRLASENQVLVVIDLKDVAPSPNHMERIKGRVIGEKGKTRRIIEETTGCYVCVGESEIGIIGNYNEAEVARQAIAMLIEGRPHSVVYKFLEREARKLKKSEMTDLWEKYPI